MHSQIPESADLLEAIATIDLGSNSFHMIVARVSDGHLQIIDKLREMVRLGEGLTPEKNLDPTVADRALACLERFGQRLNALPSANVRAVGTNTMRQIRSSDDFLIRAQQALGHPIEVIAGREEARLVYLGVAHGLAAGDERRLVVDIGGGSTELIIGEGFTPRLRESLHMGCVSVSRGFFPDAEITARAMKQAEVACAVQIRPVRSQFRDGGWNRAVGSSGSIKAIQEVVIGQGWNETGITLESLERLAMALVEAGSVENLQLKGLSDERKPVFPGGVAVLLAVFKNFGIDRMEVSSEALREGLIYDMLGRSHHEDIRDRTIEALSARYDIDEEQAQRVETTALALFRQTIRPWNLHDPRYSAMLGWAARVHEIGLAVSHSQFHKHGAYLIENSDMSGFSRQEQQVLAALVRGHRRKFPNAVFESLPSDAVTCTKQLCVLLRLAALLHRSRSAVAQGSASEPCRDAQMPREAGRDCSCNPSAFPPPMDGQVSKGQAGIVPANHLHFPHPWGSDALEVRRSGAAAVAKPHALLEVEGDRLNLKFTQGWLEKHPLTQAELELEADYLQTAGFDLSFS